MSKNIDVFIDYVCEYYVCAYLQHIYIYVLYLHMYIYNHTYAKIDVRASTNLRGFYASPFLDQPS